MPADLKPKSEFDAVIVRTLEPGSYTAIVDGVGDNKTGIAIIEVFEIQ